MTTTAEFLVTLGSLLLLGMVTDTIGRRTGLPRISLLLAFGFLIGPSAFDLLPNYVLQWFPTIADMALLMVGFLLGGRLKFRQFRGGKRKILGISVSEVLITATIVLLGLLAVGAPLEMALLLAGISPVTTPDPDLMQKIKGRRKFTRTILGVMAFDDIWALCIFIVVLTVIGLNHGKDTLMRLLLSGMWELGGALLLGLLLGIPASSLTGRLRPGEPTLLEGMGLVFLCGGIAFWLGTSYLLTVITMGVVIANLATHHVRPFHTIEEVEWPFLVFFFVLAGASFKPHVFGTVGFVGLSYIILRAGGRLLGGWLGGKLSQLDPMICPWMGVAMIPQAGVATGMALIASNRFPVIGDQILAIVVIGTMVFEIVGSLVARQMEPWEKPHGKSVPDKD